MARIEMLPTEQPAEEREEDELLKDIDKEKWLKWYRGYMAAVRRGEKPEYKPRASFVI